MGLTTMRAAALQASEFSVPNLDGLSTDPQELLEAAKVFDALASYARHTGNAMRARMRWDINAAVQLEGYAQSWYQRLPSWAKW